MPENKLRFSRVMLIGKIKDLFGSAKASSNSQIIKSSN
jgi:hypothetical protein